MYTDTVYWRSIRKLVELKSFLCIWSIVGRNVFAELPVKEFGDLTMTIRFLTSRNVSAHVESQYPFETNVMPYRNSSLSKYVRIRTGYWVCIGFTEASQIWFFSDLMHFWHIALYSGSYHNSETVTDRTGQGSGCFIILMGFSNTSFHLAY